MSKFNYMNFSDYCKAGEKGSFPVWVIEFEPLDV